MVSVSALET